MATVPQYTVDDGGFFDFRLRNALGVPIYPDWDSSLKLEFRDSGGTLRFTATTGSSPALTQETGAQGDFVQIADIDLTGWALGNVEVRIYAKTNTEEVAPYPQISVAFEIVESSTGRVTGSEVEKLIDVDDGFDFNPFIAIATQIIDEVTTGYSDAYLKELERWLTAHFVAIKVDPILEEKIGDADFKYQSGKLGEMLKFTKYGQQVLFMDYEGSLNKFGMPKMFFEAL